MRKLTNKQYHLFVPTCVCLIIVICCSLPTTVYGQKQTTPILSLEKGLIEADNGDLISIDIKVTNSQATRLKGKIIISIDEAFELVSKNEIAILQEPGEVVFHTTKVLIPRDASALKNTDFTIEFRDSSDHILETVKGQIKVNETKNVNFYILQNFIQIRNVGEILEIPVRLHNTGNTNQNITVIAKFPSLNNSQNEGYQTKKILLNAFLDTTLYIKKMVHYVMLKEGDFDVNLSCIYENGDIAGIGTSTVQSLRSRKKFKIESEDINPFNNNVLNNTLELSGQYLFTPFEAYHVRAASDIVFSGSKSKLSYSVDGQFWKNAASGNYFRDTYLRFEKNNKGITVGNINRNFDFNLVGRGVSGFIADSTGKTSLEVGWMDESYNLFDKSNFDGFENGKAWWVNLNIDKGNKGIKSVFIHESNPLYNEKQLLLTNELWSQTSDKLLISGFANSAYTQTLTGDLSKFSLAGGINLEGKFNKFVLNSENYLSSPYYPGIKRGNTIFSQRLTFVGNKNNISLDYTYNRFEPKYINIASAGSSNFTSHKAEMSVSGDISEKLNYAFAPIYYYEINKIPYGTNTFLESSINSLGSNIRFNYFNFYKKQNLYFNSDVGFYRSPLTNGITTLFHFKTSTTFQWGIFSLNLYSQFGEFYAGEISSKYFQNVYQTEMFNITPLLQGYLLNNKLRLEGGFTYLNSNLSSSGIQFTGRGEYSFNLTDKVYISYQNFKYDIAESNLTDFRVGIIKQIPDIIVQSGRKHLSMFVYKDLNGNNEFDATDSIAQDYLINVNKDVLISDSKGTALFKNLPIGRYTIGVPPSKGWYSLEKSVNLIDNQRVAIPLKRNAVLRGSVSYISGEMITFEVAKKLDGILVQATNELGIVYKTKTRESGKFVFFIPPGNYTIEIKAGDLPEKIICDKCNESITLDINEIPLIQFQLAIKERVYQVQKFISPELKKQ